MGVTYQESRRADWKPTRQLRVIALHGYHVLSCLALFDFALLTLVHCYRKFKEKEKANTLRTKRPWNVSAWCRHYYYYLIRSHWQLQNPRIFLSVKVTDTSTSEIVTIVDQGYWSRYANICLSTRTLKETPIFGKTSDAWFGFPSITSLLVWHGIAYTNAQ